MLKDFNKSLSFTEESGNLAQEYRSKGFGIYESIAIAMGYELSKKYPEKNFKQYQDVYAKKHLSQETILDIFDLIYVGIDVREELITSLPNKEVQEMVNLLLENNRLKEKEKEHQLKEKMDKLKSENENLSKKYSDER